MLVAIVLLVLGLGLLTAGADRFVVAAARLARSLGASRVLIGALVVGLGTSAPELLVSGLAAGRGELDIAIGNVVGSNISNVTLVLGAGALLAPIVSPRGVLRREGIVMLVSVGLFAALVVDLDFVRWEGALLLAGMAVAAGLLVRWSARRGEVSGPDQGLGSAGGGRYEVFIGVAALGATLLGAELLVRGATRLADEAGLTTAFVGLVVVAVGTSLPELATTLAAARRGETDLIVGNIVGSNLFNSLAVGGLAAVVGPGPIGSEFRPVALVMVGIVAVAGLLAATGHRVVRREGLILLAAFAGFVALSA